MMVLNESIQNIGCLQGSSLAQIIIQLLINLEKNNFSDLSKTLILDAINSLNIEVAVQFLLDCNNYPNVISAIQMCGPVITEELFRFTRSWCYSIHRTKLKLQGRWTKSKQIAINIQLLIYFLLPLLQNVLTIFSLKFIIWMLSKYMK